ncbi:MAG: DegT/DnrJ/EryC1/StrS family aminotransferase [Verrucomicrobiaceae bacterium]|nr:DegT/DnrJ/EryC1/StrS family aminotransferase [Verrucomicrobiaceae bacterium]
MLMINDLLRHNGSISEYLSSAVTKVIESGWYVLGNEVKEFEREFASYCETNHCVSVANGTDALELALSALDIGEGGKVITVANAGAYSTTAIRAVGAEPAYVDIDIDTMLLDLAHVKKSLNSEISAVVVTHLYGRAAPVEEVIAMADKYNIPVIEDCAQAHGATLNGKRVGSLGAFGCFSFYPTKNLGALGDGGAITTNDPLLAKRTQMLRQYGWQNKYEIALNGGRNSRLDEMQAAILRIKLPHLDSWNQRRLLICQRYTQGIRHPLITLPLFAPGSYVGHLFVVRSQQRDSLRDHLKRNNIMSEIHYPIPDYRQPAFSGQFMGVLLPITERVCNEILTLPCFPEMTNAEIQNVIDTANNWVAA